MSAAGQRHSWWRYVNVKIYTFIRDDKMFLIK